MKSMRSLRYSQELKEKAVSLREDQGLSAEEIAKRLKRSKKFKDEAAALTARSVYGIWKRARTEEDSDAQWEEHLAEGEFDVLPVRECLVTNNGDRTMLTITIPTNSVGSVLEKLGF